MTIEQQIAAAGIIAELRNSDAEKCAQDIAAVIHDAAARQAVYATFQKARPDLKAWEAQAIRSRVFCIAKEALKTPPAHPSK